MLGIGNVDCGPAIIGALANYFGERPLDVVLWDADPERLDLFARFALAAFSFNNNAHEVFATTDAAEALFEPWRIILSLDGHCAKKLLGLAGTAGKPAPAHVRSLAVQAIEKLGTSNATILSLLEPEVAVSIGPYYRLPPPPPPNDEQRTQWPHQIHRWIREDEFMWGFLHEHEQSPIKSWLDNLSCASLVNEP